MKLSIAIAVVLFACSPGESRVQSLLSPDDAGCTCPCACTGPDATVDATVVDAAIDASVDAPPPAEISMTVPWTRTMLAQGAETGPYRGADGVSPDWQGCIITPWEDGGAVTRVCPLGGAWGPAELVTTIAGAEDAKAADLDGDSVMDVVTCSDSGARCYITFRGTASVTTVLPASIGHGRAMQAAIADVDGDGFQDVIFGTRVGSPAVVAWLKHPGSVLARNGSAWTYHQISEAGWVMSLVPLDADGDGDLDVVVSDRTKNGTSWALYGSRWVEQTPSGWINHPISQPAGSCGTMACTPAEEMMLTVVDWDGDGDLDVLDGTSHAATVNSRIVLHRNDGGWLTWTHTAFPPALNVGHYQHAIAAYVDGDNLLDVIVTSWKGNGEALSPEVAARSAAYWLKAPNWERGEISGPDDIKLDNALWLNGCLVTSGQLAATTAALGVFQFCPVQ